MRRRNIYIICGVALFAPLIILLCLRFGNPQWHKWIFLFQACVQPKNLEELLVPPSGFLGTWRVWFPGGQWRAVEYLNPEHTDTNDTSGYGDQKTGEMQIRNGLPNGMCISWNRDGTLRAKGVYENGRPWKGTFEELDKTKRQFVVVAYEDGKRIGGFAEPSVRK